MIKLSRVTKYFGRTKAVDDLSFEVHEGEIFTLLGPSGCGKTTTLRLIMGLEAPDAGEISFGDRIVVSVHDRIFVPAHKRNAGMVFQSYAIWPHMTVFQNVAYPLKVRGTPAREIRERVLRVLELVDLKGLESRQGPQLSGGQQQRVALARALVHEPDMLLLDEPFSNLDAKLREQMRFQLKVLLKKIRVTVIFVTHDQTEALSLSDRTAVFQAGRIEQLASPRELYERPVSPFVRDFLGRTVLLQGKIVPGGSDDQVFVRLAGFSQIEVAVPHPPSMDLHPECPVLIAFRPEDVEVEKTDISSSDGHSLRGTVETQLFVGDRCECRIALENGESFLFYTPRSTMFREGEDVRLKIPERGIRIWQR